MRASKTFGASTQNGAEAKAQKWVKTQKDLKNLTSQSMVVRTSEGRIASNGECVWTTTIQYDE
jgi:hypothetical protein